MRAVDTNMVVRLLARDDLRQAASVEAFIGEQGAWVSLLVLAEAVWVLATIYQRPPDQLEVAIHMLLHHARLTVQEPDTVEVALAELRRKPALGFSDCLILAIARKA